MGRKDKTNYKIYSSKLFIKGMKQDRRRCRLIAESLDDYVNIIKIDKVSNPIPMEKFCKECSDYLILKAKDFKCNKSNGECDYRIIYCLKDDCCFLLDFYAKERKEDITNEEKTRMCRALIEIKMNNNYNSFRPLKGNFIRYFKDPDVD